MKPVLPFGPAVRGPRLRPLRWWWVVASAFLVVAVGIGVGWWLWHLSDGLVDPELARARAEAIRTGLTAAGGTGAALALLLAVRRQRSTEVALDLQDQDLAQKDRAAADARHDATERRITELYTKAVEQLGHSSPVKLGGMYALERLAQDNPDHRPTVVNVLCAYLRMPFEYVAPGDRDSVQSDGDTEARRLRHEELQVRQTAQRIIAEHLRPHLDENGETTNPKFWPDIDLDLTGALLVDFDLSWCRVRSTTFVETQFFGTARFRRTAFTQDARFDGADFRERAMFEGASFEGSAVFDCTSFSDIAMFRNACFGSSASFQGARLVHLTSSITPSSAAKHPSLKRKLNAARVSRTRGSGKILGSCQRRAVNLLIFEEHGFGPRMKMDVLGQPNGRNGLAPMTSRTDRGTNWSWRRTAVVQATTMNHYRTDAPHDRAIRNYGPSPAYDVRVTFDPPDS